MNFVVIIISIALSLFSTIVMSYVSLATPIGPWIAPTLVFICLLISKMIIHITQSSMAYIVSAASLGGILATACAFSFPTLYFLDASLFKEWMNNPLFFCTVLGFFSFFTGLFGLIIADIVEKFLIDKQQLSFPVGQLTYKMIAAQNQLRKAYELMAGFIAATIFSFLQGGFFLTRSIIPKVITVLPAFHMSVFSLPRIVINMDTAPMIWAIGFVTGHVITLPLAVGALAHIFFTNPLQKQFFPQVSSVEFMLAFCSGIVLFITGMSIIGLPTQIIQGIKKGMHHATTRKITHFLEMSDVWFGCITMVGLTLFLSYFNFAWYVQLYLMICSAITTYQIAAIAGRIGLALLGRFATFVMVPAMFLFSINYVQIVFIATFVEMAGGVAADVLFGRKLAQLADVSRTKMRYYQLLGLIVASVSIGIIFWLLINHFGLGSSELFAYRAQSRQLLIQTQHFDYTILLIGMMFGFCLQFIRCNPMLVLGGLLMPFDITLGLIGGGLLAALSSQKEEWYPFWSGIFASNSLCMLVRALLRV